MTSRQLRGRGVVGWRIPSAPTDVESWPEPLDAAPTRILPALQVRSRPAAATLPFVVVARPSVRSVPVELSDPSFEAVRVAAIGPRLSAPWWAMGLVAAAVAGGVAAAAL